MDLRRNYSTQKQSVNAQEGSAPFDSVSGHGTKWTQLNLMISIKRESKISANKKKNGTQWDQKVLTNWDQSGGSTLSPPGDLT